MSLVNDMLRDLDARRAGGEERASLANLRAADESSSRQGTNKRTAFWLVPLVVLCVAVGLACAHYFTRGSEVVAPEVAPVVAVAPATPANQLLDVLPQNDGKRFVLQLLLDQSVGYQRIEENGAVRLLLRGTHLSTPDAESGRVQRDGASLSWRVEQKGDDVQVLFVGLAGDVSLIDRLERAGDRWQLWLEVPLVSEADAASSDADDLANIPASAPREEALPDWRARNDSAIDTAPPRAATVSLPAAAPPVPVTAPQIMIAPHRADPLTEARQALLNGDYSRAIGQLEALNTARPEDSETARWLARAYLAAGDQMRLLAWAPAQLQRFPNDSELRVLLARAQLQGGDSQTAVTTLQTNPPPLAKDPSYHALLAAAFQQTGQWRESATRYGMLLALRPREGAWQLGMAIALEQLGQATQAAGFYAQAQQNPGLDDNSRRFAAERARILGGQS
ncbi:tetratricopeptide repeat protein [Pseudomonas matsuisoli]|uniref:MSHA biogenesis protein MshN n=1 Tax=Pseudomonas matsuisoli TaxID=1515666 RepID=A0A917Q0S0_9PSED|nr:tetratricopeptide repeat protein [Pseudomonas matsuisoli]GGK04344.1 hypothetical protein GCM10009304_32960 [Pseudomonas matsuisoli]